MNDSQRAALGPRYADFKAVYGRSSGVALGCALAYGIDVDAFRRAPEPCRLAGTLVLKVWSRRSTWRMIWCYVTRDDGQMTCFPVFPSSLDAPESPARTLMATPLGSTVAVELQRNAHGKIVCGKVEYALP